MSVTGEASRVSFEGREVNIAIFVCSESIPAGGMAVAQQTQLSCARQRSMLSVGSLRASLKIAQKRHRVVGAFGGDEYVIVLGGGDNIGGDLFARQLAGHCGCQPDAGNGRKHH